MNVKIDVNLTKALKIIKQCPIEGRKALVSALNKTGAMVNTASRREIMSVYNLKARDFKSHNIKGQVTGNKVIVNKARSNKLGVSLNVLGHRLGMYLFGAKTIKSKVSVEIRKGHRFTLNRAFIGIWRKGSPLKWVMETDKSKPKIRRLSPTSGKPYDAWRRKALYTLSLPELYSTKRVGKKIREVAAKNFFRIFQHEFTARIKGFVKSRKAA